MHIAMSAGFNEDLN